MAPNGRNPGRRFWRSMRVGDGREFVPRGEWIGGAQKRRRPKGGEEVR